jgi:hypothetical protein
LAEANCSAGGPGIVGRIKTKKETLSCVCSIWFDLLRSWFRLDDRVLQMATGREGDVHLSDDCTRRRSLSQGWF